MTTSLLFPSFQIFHCVHFECPAQDAQSKTALELELKSNNSNNNNIQTAPEQGTSGTVTIAGTSGQSKNGDLLRYELRRPMTALELKRFRRQQVEDDDLVDGSEEGDTEASDEQ